MKAAIELLLQEMLSQPQAFGLRDDIDGKDIHITMHAPYVESATGRVHYRVYIGKSVVPTIIAQAASLNSAKPLASRNPYVPEHNANLLADLLPSPVGEITSGERPIYWAKYLPWPSLREKFPDLASYAALAQRLQQPPWSSSTSTLGSHLPDNGESLSNYLSMTHEVCLLLDELRPLETELLTLFQHHWHDMKLGFSHGDLWVQDILRSDTGQICILDWEWSAPARPIGTDLFHLAVSALEFGYRIQTGEAITCLIWGKGKVEAFYRAELRKLWDELQCSDEVRWTYGIAYLVYIQSRIALQYPRNMSGAFHGVARILTTLVKTPAYFAPLSGSWSLVDAYDSRRVDR